MDLSQIKKRYYGLEKLYNKINSFGEKQESVLYTISFLFFIIFSSISILLILILLCYGLLFKNTNRLVDILPIILILVVLGIPFYILLFMRGYIETIVIGLKDSIDDKKYREGETKIAKKYDISIMPNLKFWLLYWVTYTSFIIIQITFILLIIIGLILLIMNRNIIINAINIKVIGIIIIILLAIIIAKLYTKQ